MEENINTQPVEENPTPAGEPVQPETPQAASAAEAPRSEKTSPAAWEQFLDEVGAMAVSFGRAAGRAAEDLTGLMVLPVDKETRAKLDQFIESGAVETRAQAVLSLLKDGIRSNQSIYDRVEKTQAQIQALKSQLRSLVNP